MFFMSAKVMRITSRMTGIVQMSLRMTNAAI
jgi:hypothetical protein